MSEKYSNMKYLRPGFRFMAYAMGCLCYEL